MKSQLSSGIFTMAFLCILMSLFVQNIDAQNVNNQRQLDERLARELYSKKDYEKARDIYKNLYDKHGQTQYFNQYADCLILTGDYDTAEKAYKSFLKKNPQNWKSHVDLAYVYLQQGDNSKAVKYLNKMLKDVPDTRSAINEVANLLRIRNFNDAAISLYDRGAKNPNVNYSFNLEKAYAYNSMLDFENATECYLQYLKEKPDQ